MKSKTPRFHPAYGDIPVARVRCNGRPRPGLPAPWAFGGRLRSGSLRRLTQGNSSDHAPLCALSSGFFSINAILRCYYITDNVHCQGMISPDLRRISGMKPCTCQRAGYVMPSTRWSSVVLQVVLSPIRRHGWQQAAIATRLVVAGTRSLIPIPWWVRPRPAAIRLPRHQGMDRPG